MALDLARPRTGVKSFELQVFELAYLLSLMKVETVAALPDAVLFPTDPQVRKKVLVDGRTRLIRNGWITPAEAAGTAEYDSCLLSMAAALASPRFTILIRREDSDGARKNAAIFFNGVEIVEVVQTDRHIFRLTRMTSLADAFQRVRKTLHVSPTPREREIHAVVLSIESFEQARRSVKAKEPGDARGLLIESGAAPQTADSIVAALENPDRKGVVSVLKHAAQKVADVRVLGFYGAAGETWLTSVVSEASHEVRIEAVGAEDFLRRLVDLVASVQR